LRLTIDSTDDPEAAIAALGALFGVRLAVVAHDAVRDTAEPATTSVPAGPAASRAPRRRPKSNAGRTAGRATRADRRQSARKAAPSSDLRSARKAASGTAGTSTAMNAQIRSWAHTQGIAVASRGRIATNVVNAYRAAHPN
jgi:hypothetical protein